MGGSRALALGWPLVCGSPPPTLGTLTISPNTASLGQAYSGTISGATPGSTITLDSLTVTGSGTTRAVTGTPTGNSGNWPATETLAGAVNSPKTTQGLLTVNVYVPPLTALRATNAGFAPVFEINPSTGTSITTRMLTAPFNEPIDAFEVVYQLFRNRTGSFTASIDNGAGAAGDILNVTALNTGAVVPGITIVGTGVTTGTYVVSQLTGDVGSVGTYKLSVVQAAVVASSTMTSPNYADEAFQGGGAIQTYETCYEDAPTTALTGIPAGRPRVTWDGGALSKTRNYTNDDKSILYLMSDKMTRPRRSADPIAIWTRVMLPSNLPGLPVNKYACAAFANRGWGSEFVTSGLSADPANATSITGVTTTAGSFTACVVPVALRIYTAGGAMTTIGLGDSRSSFTGLGNVNEPAGFGDTQGDIYGRGSEMERGMHSVAQQHSLMLGKPTDRAYYLAQSPLAWRGRLQIMQLCGANSAAEKMVLNAYGQNDQSDAPTNFANNMVLRQGLAITTGNRVYVVTSAGTAGTVAPTSTAMGTDITLNTATVRYFGTDANATNRIGLAIAGKNYIINTALKVAMPGIAVAQEGLGPFTSPTFAISSLTNTGTAATAVHATTLTNGQSVTIAGAVQSAYNGTFTITVVDANTFTYTMLSDPGTTTATGSPTGNIGDNYKSASQQSDNFNSAAGRAYLASLAANGAVLTNADRILSSMPLLAGSRTVDGGPDDGSRTWGTPAPRVSFNLTPDGIHRGNRGAEIGKAAYTKLAVTGSA
jgi:hypothetical protein